MISRRVRILNAVGRTPNSSRDRAGMRNLDQRFAEALRRRGRFNFCLRASVDGKDSEDVVWLCAGVQLVVRNKKKKIKYHYIERVPGEAHHYAIDPIASEHSADVDQILRPLDFRLSTVVGKQGHYRLSPAVEQAVNETKYRIVSGEDLS